MFYITWGTKTYQQREGVAADYCPICRCPSIVEVYQIRSQTHVYHIGFGKGTLVGHLVQCHTCKSEWALQAGTIQNSVNPTQTVTLEELIQATYPRLAIVNAERFEQDAALWRDPFSLSPETRLALLAEPFFVLDNAIRKQDRRELAPENILPGLGCLVTIGFALGTVGMFIGGLPLGGVLLLTLTLGLGWLTMRLTTAATERFMREQIYPRLAKALAPVQPTPEELQIVLRDLDSKTAKQTNLEQLAPFLEAARANVRTAQTTHGL